MTWPAEGRPRPRQYRKDRELVLARANHRCQIQGPNCTGVGNLDDHIVPLSLGGSNDLDNRQAACKTCHDAKTAREASAAAAASRAKGRRPARQHPGLR